MGALTASLLETEVILRSAGIEAAIDPRDLNLPAIWITADTVAYDRLSLDVATVDVQLFAIVDDTGTPSSLVELDSLTSAANAALGTTTWEARSMLLVSHSPAPLPAMTTTIQLEWRK